MSVLSNIIESVLSVLLKSSSRSSSTAPTSRTQQGSDLQPIAGKPEMHRVGGNREYGDDREHGGDREYGSEGNEFGRFGADATTEIDPRRLGAVRMAYSPITDGDPDPGEIVWTWVPYEERDGRGKDRPVLIVASGEGPTVLAVQLTSKQHGGDHDFVALGAGAWDFDGRPSWVNIDRVFSVHPTGMRREAAALDAERFGKVAGALHARYGWS